MQLLLCGTISLRLYIGITLLYLLTLTASGCDSSDTAAVEPVTITLTGSTAAQPALQELSHAFSLLYPHVTIEMHGGESILGEQQVQAGEADLAASILTPSELSPPIVVTQSTKAQTPLVHVPIALDALAIIVHARNPLDNITLLQLRDVYSGRIIDWADLGDEEDDILLVTREEGSGSWQLFTERVMGEEPISLTAVVMPTNADIVDFVSRQPMAIGYVSRAYVADALAASEAASDEAIAAGSSGQIDSQSGGASVNLLRIESADVPVRVVRLESELPTVAKLQEQKYHLTYPLFLVSRGQPAGWLREFIDFTLSPEGQVIVGRYHARVR